MIKVVIFGAAGRMGRRLVANVLADPRFELVGAVDCAASGELGKDAGALAGVEPCGIAVTADAAPLFPRCDVVINFATAGVVECAAFAVAANAGIVIGTTALSSKDRAELGRLAASGGRIVVASNMSVGVNLLFKLVKEAARILGNDCDVEIVEMHHRHKKDAPSGTAVRLAEVVCEARQWNYEKDVRHGRSGIVGERPDREIGMHALRGGDTVGDHTVMFATEGERIELTHRASSRDAFARGALRAAAFLKDAGAGLYDMQDVLHFK